MLLRRCLCWKMARTSVARINRKVESGIWKYLYFSSITTVLFHLCWEHTYSCSLQLSLRKLLLYFLMSHFHNNTEHTFCLSDLRISDKCKSIVVSSFIHVSVFILFLSDIVFFLHNVIGMWQWQVRVCLWIIFHAEFGSVFNMRFLCKT